MKLSFALALITFGTAACGSDALDSDEEARRAYLGLDLSIEKSLALGFAGFNAASSANIDPQLDAGEGGGMLTITGQVDQGASANKGMRLRVGMVAYTEGLVRIEDEDGNAIDIAITYDTAADPASQPALDLQLRGIPSGTFTGTLVGTYSMTGDIEGDVDLNLAFTGTLMPMGQGTVRAPGTTVTGTATSGDGVFDVNLTL